MIKNSSRSTLLQVAKKAGVHVSTASRALNAKTRHMIGPSIVKNIEKIALELNYKPNRLARALRTNKSNGIGIIVPDITNSIFSSMILGIENALERQNYVPVTVNMSEKIENSLINKIDLLRNFGVDGLILATGDHPQINYNDILDTGTPIVMLNRSSENPKLNSILPDDTEGIKKAFDYLWSLGHRKISMISGPQNISTGQLRSKEFKRIVSSLNKTEKDFPVFYANSYNEEEGEFCMNEIFKYRNKVSGIICGNDRLAIGALGAIKNKSLNCPEDYSIVGFNNMPLSERIDPPLTTIDIKPYEMGFLAAEKLLSLLNSKPFKEDKITYQPVELIIRSSCKVR